jgi:hypothetical protein
MCGRCSRIVCFVPNECALRPKLPAEPSGKSNPRGSVQLRKNGYWQISLCHPINSIIQRALAPRSSFQSRSTSKSSIQPTRSLAQDVPESTHASPASPHFSVCQKHFPQRQVFDSISFAQQKRSFGEAFVVFSNGQSTSAKSRTTSCTY